MDTRTLKKLVEKSNELIEAIEELEEKQDTTTNRFMDIAAEIEGTENPHTDRLKRLRVEVREMAVELAADLMDFELQHSRDTPGRILRIDEYGRPYRDYAISGAYIQATSTGFYPTTTGIHESFEASGELYIPPPEWYTTT